jgi:hypothetical protein
MQRPKRRAKDSRQSSYGDRRGALLLQEARPFHCMEQPCRSSSWRSQAYPQAFIQGHAALSAPETAHKHRKSFRSLHQTWQAPHHPKIPPETRRHSAATTLTVRFHVRCHAASPHVPHRLFPGRRNPLLEWWSDYLSLTFQSCTGPWQSHSTVSLLSMKPYSSEQASPSQDRFLFPRQLCHLLIPPPKSNATQRADKHGQLLQHFSIQECPDWLTCMGLMEDLQPDSVRSTGPTPICTQRREPRRAPFWLSVPSGTRS